MELKRTTTRKKIRTFPTYPTIIPSIIVVVRSLFMLFSSAFPSARGSFVCVWTWETKHLFPHTCTILCRLIGCRVTFDQLEQHKRDTQRRPFFIGYVSIGCRKALFMLNYSSVIVSWPMATSNSKRSRSMNRACTVYVFLIWTAANDGSYEAVGENLKSRPFDPK